MNRIAIVFVFVALLAGCTAIELGDTDAVSSYEKAMAPAAPAAYDGGSASGSYVVKEGSITLKVPEGTLEARVETLKDDLNRQGAEVTNIAYNEYGERLQYTTTIKVPPAKFESISDMLKEAGEVKGMSVSLEDVTQQYTDLET
ncbi:MAG: DUF4349 domain-containing protein, partial [Candidatus Micrarchaeota archaeon]